MDRILANRHLRRIFLVMLAVGVALAATLRWIISEHTDGTGVWAAAARILDGVVASSIVTVVVGLAVYLGTSQVREATEQITVIASGDISDQFEAAHRTANRWHFKGGLGRYVTAVTLPRVLANGRAAYDFRVFIVDPFNPQLCEHVADERKGSYTPATVRHEALATVVEFTRIVHSRRNDIAEAHCCLIDDFSAMRIDLMDDAVLVTHDDRKSPAVRYDAKSFVYRSYQKELTTSPNSYARVDIMQVVGALACGPAKVREMTASYATAALQAVLDNLETPREKPAMPSAPEIDQVVKVANSRKNPY